MTALRRGVVIAVLSAFVAAVAVIAAVVIVAVGWWLFWTVAGVAAFGIVMFVGLGAAILNEAEVQRMELSAAGKRCGLSPRA